MYLLRSPPKPTLNLSPKNAEVLSAKKVVPLNTQSSLKRESMVKTMEQDDGLSLISELGLGEDMDFMENDNMVNTDKDLSTCLARFICSCTYNIRKATCLTM